MSYISSNLPFTSWSTLYENFGERIKSEVCDHILLNVKKNKNSKLDDESHLSYKLQKLSIYDIYGVSEISDEFLDIFFNYK